MISIRLLEKDDWIGLYNLIKPVNRELVGMISDPEELVEDWINNIEEGIWEVYLAILPQNEIQKEEKRIHRKIFPWKHLKENPKGIVGLVTLYGDWKEDDDLNEGEFDIGISVADSYQKRGIGKELMKYILDRGEELGFKRATLLTRTDNKSMKILAQKVGFIPSKKRKRNGHNWQKFIFDLEKRKK